MIPSEDRDAPDDPDNPDNPDDLEDADQIFLVKKFFFVESYQEKKAKEVKIVVV